MQTSPIPPEWKGDPKIMFIIDTPMSMSSDFAQTPLVEATRLRFIQLIENYFDSWYITPLVKCRPRNKTHTVGDYKSCCSWLNKEFEILSPSVTIGCGSKVEKYFSCDHYTMSPARITQSRKHEEMFEKILEKVKLHAN